MRTATQQLALSDFDTSAVHVVAPVPASPAIVRQMEAWGATELFDVYWYFAVERQALFLRRLAGSPAPWTDDPILSEHRFTNPYRFTDRVSQFLLRHVQHNAAWSSRDVVFRTLLFKIFNKIETWRSIVEEFGEPTADAFKPNDYASLLRHLMAEGVRIYSAAYIVPNPPLGSKSKHENHLALLETLLTNGTIDRLPRAESLRNVYDVLTTVPSFGPFLSFQYAIDINYTFVTTSDEENFVVAGPGALSGLAKCFAALPRDAIDDALLWVTETQDAHFARLGLGFTRVAGRRLQPIDCQNLFCEVDKYSRVSHPGRQGLSQRTRIKQKFTANDRAPLPPLFVPPKWLDHHTAQRQ